MGNFIKIQIYKLANNSDKVCFDDIKSSHKPYITINVDNIVLITQAECWGFCVGNENYPYRVIKMIDGTMIYCPEKSADNLENMLINCHEIQNH